MNAKRLAEAILKYPDYRVTVRESDYRNPDLSATIRDFIVDHELKQIRAYTWC
jgi:hypothetical protein